MSKPYQFKATNQPVIYDSKGRAMSRKYSLGDYEASRDTRQRTLYGNFNSHRSQDETELLPFSDRIKIISYLRKSVRNNPVMAALCLRYALSVGSPSVHFNTPDGGVNDEKERAVENRLKNICYGTGWSWHRLHKILSIEELIAGESFAVWTDGKIQLIPSELCGSSSKPLDNEIDGIVYDDTGAPILYRFGVRKRYYGYGSNSTTISYEEEDGATLVDAEFVHHIGQPSRIEERRFSPKLSSVIGLIQDLDDVMKAKVTTVKNQSAMSILFTKNFDPALFAEASAMASVVESNSQNLLEQATARSTYQDVSNGQIIYSEVGEDVKLLEPKLNAQDFDLFKISLLDQICAPVGLFAEEVLIGYRNSSYSSARADRIKLSDTLNDLRKERSFFCDNVIGRIIGISVDSGEIQEASDGMADVTYGWPVVREIDEQKHVAAQAVSLANGSKSLEQICAENGTFADQVQAQIVRCAVRQAKLVKAYSVTNYPTKAQIEAQTVTQAEILAHMPNSQAASEALNNIQTASAAEVNAEANANRAQNTNS